MLWFRRIIANLVFCIKGIVGRAGTVSPMSGKSDRREDIASLFVFVFYGILVAEEKNCIFPLMGD